MNGEEVMSRSKKGEKGPGYDYWGKRALSGICGYGKAVKIVTKKIERSRAKQKISKKQYESLKSKEAI